MHKILALITARGGSKGLPGKNILPLGGKPLIAWTIEAAQQARSIDRIVVSTDDVKIAEVARDCGAEVPFVRPAELAGDTSPHIDVILHAMDALASIDACQPVWLMLLQPTSPFRTADDIDRAAQLVFEKDAPAIVSVVETHDHPYLVRKIGANGALEPFVTCDIAYPRRQDLPQAYALNGAIYLCRTETIRRLRTLEPPGTIAYPMPPNRSLQIDTAWDLEMCELVARNSAMSPRQQAQGRFSGTCR